MSACANCQAPQPLEFQHYHSENLYTWCTNCGNYGIHAAVKRALVAEQQAPKDTLLCFDIGCHGNGSDKIGGYTFHGLHGRVLAFACGAAVANRRVKVLAFGGDGGTLGEGIGHLLNAIRGDYEVTFILHNNLNYGLTTGQASATTKMGISMNSSPDGVTSDPMHPMRLVLSLNPSFAARSFSGDVKHMTEVIRAGIRHPGFSFIEILQSCPTYNLMTPHEWYQQRVFSLADKPAYDPSDLSHAMAAAEDIDDHIALGVLYQRPHARPFMQRQANRLEVQTELVDEVRAGDARALFAALG